MAVQRWGSQTIVNTTTAGRQVVPSVAALADGGYVIAWQDGAGDPPAFARSASMPPAARSAANSRSTRSPEPVMTVGRPPLH